MEIGGRDTHAKNTGRAGGSALFEIMVIVD